MSSPYGRGGTIRQQDNQACNIARSAIARSLALEAQRTGVIVSAIIAKIMLNQATPAPIDNLWTRIQNDATLREIKAKTDANIDAYRQFAGWVQGERRNIEYDQKRRLDDEIGFRIFAQRFGNNPRLVRLHLIPA
jgi:hypothetical protein